MSYTGHSAMAPPSLPKVTGHAEDSGHLGIGYFSGWPLLRLLVSEVLGEVASKT